MFVPVPCRRVAVALMMVGTAALGACVPTYDDRGDLPPKYRLAEIHPGSTTKAEVVKLLGSPSSIGVFDDNSWYYISRKTKQISFFEPEVLDQQVYVVDFDQRGVVRSVGHRSLADARDIEPAPGATPAPGRQLTFLEQVIGNVGRFNKGSTSSGSGTDEDRQAGPVPNAGTNGRPPTN